MKRLLSGALASAMALTFLCTAPAFAKNTSNTMHSSMSSSMHHHMKKSCPAGQHWVHGYKTKSGKKVHGYCRA
jgi:hypothetical protein